MTHTPSSDVVQLANRTRARITRHLLPYLFLLYVINYLDRVNISYAALDMTRDLGFSNAVFGFGAGIFFIGYFVLQIPGTMLVELWSARKWIAITLVCWGCLATVTGLISTAHQLYGIRFLLGAAEAGFFPGVIVYLTHWYRYEDRGKAVALFMAAIPFSNILGAPIAGLLMRIDWLGVPGWRWLLLLEGLPAVVLGIVTWFYLSDRPSDAPWLAPDERQWISSELARERAAKKAKGTLSVWQSLRSRDVVLLAGTYFCLMTSSYGFGLWLPKILQRLSGLGTLDVALIAAIPWLAALPAMLLSGWHSDKTGERRWHTALWMFAVGAGLACSQWAGQNVALAIVMFAVAAMGLYGAVSPFWALPTLFLSESAAAVAVGFINSVGNLGGFVGPYAVGFLSDRTGSYASGMFYLVAMAVVGGVLVLALRPAHQPRS